MNERTGQSVPVGLAIAGALSHGAVGRPLVAASAGCMLIVLALLCWGHWLEAIITFLLTVGVLDVMLRRALARFDAPSEKLARHPRYVDRPQPPTVGGEAP
jgi:membrane protein implicated in regulation of membrane protease activity